MLKVGGVMNVEALERELAQLVHDNDPADRPRLDVVLTRLAIARAEQART